MESPGLPEPAIASLRHSVIRNAASAVLRFFHRQYLFMICIFLHLLSVGAHIVLIVFNFKEHQFLAKETLTTDLIFLAVVMAPTAVVRVRAASLPATAQD